MFGPMDDYTEPPTQDQEDLEDDYCEDDDFDWDAEDPLENEDE